MSAIVVPGFLDDDRVAHLFTPFSRLGIAAFIASRFSNTPSAWYLLVMSPHAQHLHNVALLNDFVDQPVLYIDAAGICPS